MFFAALSIRKVERDDTDSFALLGGDTPTALGEKQSEASVVSYLIACTSCKRYRRSSASGAEASVSIAYSRTYEPFTNKLDFHNT